MKKETIVPLVTFNQWHTFDTFFPPFVKNQSAIHFAYFLVSFTRLTHFILTRYVVIKQTELLSYLFLTPTDKPIAYSYIFWEALFTN